MRSSATLILRTSVVLGMLIAMPVLAIPWVNRGLNGWLRCEATDRPHESGGLARGAESHGTTTVEFRAAQVVQLQDQPIQEQLLRIRHQLERAGADYMVLEARPERQRRYRFHCRIRLPGSMVYSRVFEATDADPRQAMQRVLAEIRAWQRATDSSGDLESSGGADADP